MVSKFSEWGPRALGNRSIIVDPRMKDARLIKFKIKKRESLDLSAPSILYEHQEDWSDNIYSPYMSYVIKFKQKRENWFHQFVMLMDW